jgi:Domain of unknown function (DUF4190)
MGNGPYGMGPGGGPMGPQQPPNPYAPPQAFGGGPPMGPGMGAEAPGAKQALIMGILSLFCCGILLGPFAIVQANKAKQAIAMDPTLRGGGMATAGMILGIIALILNVLGIVARLALMGHR